MMAGKGDSKSESDGEPEPKPKSESTSTKPTAEHSYGHCRKKGGPTECVSNDEEWYRN